MHGRCKDVAGHRGEGGDLGHLHESESLVFKSLDRVFKSLLILSHRARNSLEVHCLSAVYSCQPHAAMYLIAILVSKSTNSRHSGQPPCISRLVQLVCSARSQLVHAMAILATGSQHTGESHLARHRPEGTHLPEQPLLQLGELAGVGRRHKL